jgi:two-component system, OmpR family, response regulator RegX3
MGARRVLLVEDHDSISEPLSSILRSDGYDPTVARSAAEARALFERLQPDLLLLDLMLPDGDGRDLCREVRQQSDVPIVMLTARAEISDRVLGLELGADDYVVKPFNPAELTARIRAVLRRTRTGAVAGATPQATRHRSPALEFTDLRIDLAARRATLRGRELRLSRKEFDLLALLARNAGQVMQRDELLAEIWDANWFGSTHTLDVHIGWLRRKLGDDAATPRYIHTVRGVGFRFCDHRGAS